MPRKMPARIKVPLFQRPLANAVVEDGATVGAVVGVNLWDTSGELVDLQALIAAEVGALTPSGVQPTTWALILDVPPNVQGLAELEDAGLVTRTAAGAIVARAIDAVAGETTVTNPAGDAGNPAVGLADVADGGGGALVKVTFDGKGRRTGTSAVAAGDLTPLLDPVYIRLTEKGAALGVAPLDAGGKVDATYLPPIAITDTFVVASQAAMLALTAEVGDVAVRTDITKTFILSASPPTVLANWVELLFPADAVSSVFGRTGTVVALAGDYAAFYDALGSAAAAQAASQPLDQTLTALAAQNWVANAMPLGTGADTVTQLALAANTFPARSSAGDVAAKPITDAALAFNAAATLALMRTAIGLGSGDSPTFFNITATGGGITSPALMLTPGAAPGALSNGWLWYDNGAANLRAYIGGATRDLWHSGNLLNIGTTDATARTALNLGTAAVENIGTSGNAVPKLNANNTTSGNNTHSGTETFENTANFGGTRNAGASLNGQLLNPTIGSAVTTNFTGAATAFSSTAAVFNTSTVHHWLAQNWTPGAGHTITDQFAFRVGALSAATTNYAFAGSIGLTAGWNCYMNGQAPNYFAGEVRVGSQTDKGAYQLQVSGAPLLVDEVGSLSQLTGSALPAIGAGTIHVFARSTSAGAQAVVSLISGNTSTLCGVNFGDTDSETVARFSYDHSAGAFTLRIESVNTYLWTGSAYTPVTAGLASLGTTALPWLNLVTSGARYDTGTESPASWAANVDNLAIAATTRVLRVQGTAARDFTGIVPGSAGRRVLVCNIGAFNITLKHNLTSTAANRFFCPGSVDLILHPNDAVELWYDTASSRWRVVGY